MDPSSDKKRKRLLHRAWEWAAKIEDANSRAQLRGSRVPDFDPWQVHGMALALDHLASCLKFLDALGEPPPIREAAAAFRMAWERTPVSTRDGVGRPITLQGKNQPPTLRQLRNVLEHEENYIAGHNIHYPELIASDDGQGPCVISGLDGIEVFVLFGVTYDLQDVVARAIECKTVLELVIGTPSNPLPLPE